MWGEVFYIPVTFGVSSFPILAQGVPLHWAFALLTQRTFLQIPHSPITYSKGRFVRLSQKTMYWILLLWPDSPSLPQESLAAKNWERVDAPLPRAALGQPRVLHIVRTKPCGCRPGWPQGYLRAQNAFAGLIWNHTPARSLYSSVHFHFLPVASLAPHADATVINHDLWSLLLSQSPQSCSPDPSVALGMESRASRVLDKLCLWAVPQTCAGFFHSC